MFIVAAAVPANPLTPLWPALIMAVGAALAVRLGVYRPRSIQGPLRITAEDSVEPLAIAGFCGLGIYLTLVSLIRIPLQFSKSALSPDEAKNVQLLLPDMLARAAAVAIIVAILITLFRQPRRLGFFGRDFFPGLWRGALSFLIVLPLMLLALAGTEKLWTLLHYQGEHIAEQLQWMGKVPDPRLRIFVIVSVVVAAPISEELLFRGCLQTWVSGMLARAFHGKAAVRTRWLAVIFTSLLFAGVHPWWEAPPIFVLSLCLGYAYERTGNLWTPIVIHAIFNSASVVAFLIRE